MPENPPQDSGSVVNPTSAPQARDDATALAAAKRHVDQSAASRVKSASVTLDISVPNYKIDDVIQAAS
ncbi:MAG TPA: hypothetical protein VGO80_11145 [Solirubrobacteraceae bacterium]|jgi:hypothetical protein|nr:hypothetical protein [Solirubrobacteraceae bacterium]